MDGQDNVKALKNLAVAIIGGALTVEDIDTTTIAETINYIAENYPTSTS